MTMLKCKSKPNELINFVHTSPTVYEWTAQQCWYYLFI